MKCVLRLQSAIIRLNKLGSEHSDNFHTGSSFNVLLTLINIKIVFVLISKCEV